MQLGLGYCGAVRSLSSTSPSFFLSFLSFFPLVNLACDAQRIVQLTVLFVRREMTIKREAVRYESRYGRSATAKMGY